MQAGMVEPRLMHVSWVRRWWVAGRPWALPASVMPVVYGTVLAVVVGGARFDGVGFVLAVLGMVLLHTAANMWSDVMDFRRGLDREPTPVSGAIVRGWLSQRQVLAAAVPLGLLGMAIGAWLARTRSPALWGIGGLGIAIGMGYPVLKSAALGDLAVFLNFGTLGAVGAWAVQTGRFSAYPVIAALPLSLLVVAILHANNWRDIAGDRQGGVRTVAAWLGERASLHYYGALIFAPFGLVAALIWSPRRLGGADMALPVSCALAFLAAPKAFGLWRQARLRAAGRRDPVLMALDGATAELNLVFSALLTLGVVAAAWWEPLR